MVPPISSPYFVSHKLGTTVSVRDAGDNAVEVEEMPQSVDPEDFAPRLVNIVVSRLSEFGDAVVKCLGSLASDVKSQ